MAIDMPRLIAAMKDALLRELGGEIDLIIQYGSHLKGAAHPYSDLDLSYVPARAFTGIAYSDFNSLTEYEQNLVALGFPALLPHVVSGDFVALHRACLAFDQHLQRFLRDHAVQLNAFDSIDALQEYLDSRTLC